MESMGMKRAENWDKLVMWPAKNRVNMGMRVLKTTQEQNQHGTGDNMGIKRAENINNMGTSTTLFKG